MWFSKPLTIAAPEASETRARFLAFFTYIIFLITIHAAFMITNPR